MSRFQDRVYIVTGGSSGIGRAVARQLARQGAHVAVAARGEDRGREVVEKIEGEGGEAVFVQTDVGEPQQVRALVEDTVDTFGRLDGAVNNAGSTAGSSVALADLSEKDFDASIQTNLKGVWLGMKHQIQQMLSQDPPGGVIVNVSSVNGLGGARLGSVYSAAKAGVLGLTKSAAQEYAQQGIRINALVPGTFDTPMLRGSMESLASVVGATAQDVERQILGLVPQGRIGQPDEAARTILFLLSDDASYVTGNSFIVDGGLTSSMR